MKGQRPSRTAHFVALGRAIADAGLSHVPDFHDPTARVFLNEKGKQSLAKIERAVQERKAQHAGRNGARDGGHDRPSHRGHRHGGARRDRRWRDAARHPRRRLRRARVAHARARRRKVFEVDHPATQGDKRAHVAELPPPTGVVSFVSIDFERESLDAALERAGHDRSSPTCWIWEGVVMYLTRDAMRATLAGIAGRSAPGSTLIVNYHTDPSPTSLRG